ncbi:hypothetical protein PMAYCL1PPCAC_32709, partial [Pristionchus mayeri]
RKRSEDDRTQSIYKEATLRLRPNALRNSPIAYDLNKAKEHMPKLEDNKYTSKARERCKDDVECYVTDQMLYAALAQEFRVNATLTSIESTESLEATINAYTTDTSAIIDDLIRAFDVTVFGKMDDVEIFNRLQSRIQMIEFMKTNCTYGDFHEIKDIAEVMKTKMVENIEASTWLHGDEISNFIREKIKERVASIQIYHDFDEYDKNLTIILELNRDINQLFFSNQRKTGVFALDTLVGLQLAMGETLLKNENSTEISNMIVRIVDNFEYNAKFDPARKTATMYAPFMSREAYQTDIFKEPFITYHTLGHELYHSLFAPENGILLSLYSHRGECVANHYQRSCSKFSIGACGSGNQTITEDGPDLESFRLQHNILQETYNDEELNANIDGLDTTLEQAFFYYIANGWCDRDAIMSEEDAKDVHSAFNIRINAALSLMPEFSNAFQCKEGDEMFVDTEGSCFVFGPNSRA